MVVAEKLAVRSWLPQIFTKKWSSRRPLLLMRASRWPHRVSPAPVSARPSKDPNWATGSNFAPLYAI
jgi:hypothetical protein